MCGNNYGTQLGTLWVESVLWGFYVALYAASVYTIATQQRDKRLMVVLTLNFLLSTSRMGTDVVGILLTPNFSCNTECIGLHSNCQTCGVETASTVHQSDIFNLASLITTALFTTNQLIADGFLIWRCYAVWGFSYYPVVAPILLLLGTTACGYAQLYPWTQDYLLRLRAPLNEVSPPPKWFYYGDLNSSLQTSYISLALATNVIVTSLIIGRVMHMMLGIEKEFMRKKRTYTTAISILVESGALIALNYIVLISVQYSNEQGNTIVQAVLGQIIGIAPALVILRLRLNKAGDQTLLDLAVADGINRNRTPACKDSPVMEPAVFASPAMSSYEEHPKRYEDKNASILDASAHQIAFKFGIGRQADAASSRSFD